MHDSLPCVDSRGVIRDGPVKHFGQPLADCVPLDPAGDTHTVTFELTAVTYNCLSLQALHHREHLDKLFFRRGFCAVGLQETRTTVNPRGDSLNFFVLGGSADSGQLGVQLWLAKRTPVARTPRGPVYWEGDNMSVILATPRILVATARVAAKTFGFVVAHAPTGKATAAVRTQWWKDLSSSLRRLPPRCIPFLFIDANAQFEWCPDPPRADRALDHNAKELSSALAEHKLLASPNVSANGKRLVTWQGPARLECCLDYVVCAEGFGPAVQAVDAFPDFEGLADHDHFLLQVTFRWTDQAQPPTRPLRVDRQAMRTPEGKRIIKHIFDSAPRVPWEFDVDTHLAQLNQHLGRALRQAFPLEAARPRSYIIQEYTWLHIRHRRELRRTLFRCRQDTRAAVLSHFFDAWRGRALQPVPIKFRRLHEAFLVRQLRDLSASVRRGTRADRAKAARDAMQTARTKGPDAKFNLIRGILRCGRRYRAPTLQPSIVDVEGATVDDPHRELGLHFGKAERASLVDGSQLVPVPIRPPKAPLLAHGNVGVCALARGYGALQPHKTTGPSGLPPELYRADPIGAASLHCPLVMKVQLRGVMPGLWRGGHATPIPKPEKPLQSLDGWRSILLTECAVKGLQKALREPLLSCMHAVKTQAQGGSVPGGPLQVPMAWAQGHLQRLHEQRVSGGILYIDGKAAFYSTIREGLMGHESGHSIEFLNRLSEAVFEDAEDRLTFMATALGPSLLERHDVPEALRRVIVASLKDTWYTVGRDRKHVFATRTGTCPGSPIADVAFQVLFAEAIDRVEQILRDFAHDSTRSTDGEYTPAPSWMDDLAVPLRSTDGDALMELAASTLRAVFLGMRQMGLEINLSRGKTELMPIFYGKGSKQARQRWLIEEGAGLNVELAPNQHVRVGMTGHYIHLGARLDVSGRDSQTIRHRACLMREMIKPLRRLLRSPDLEESEKIEMIVSMPHARLRHGSGFWKLSTERERASFHAAYYEAPRRLFRLVTTLSTQGVSDEDVSLILGIPRAHEVRDADVLRQLGWVLAAQQPRLQGLWLDSEWGKVARLATQQVVHKLGQHFESSWNSLLRDPSLASRWARRYLRACVAGRSPFCAQRRAELTAMQVARDAGVIFCRLKPDKQPPVDGATCASCGAVFKTKAAMAAHCSKVHHATAPATQHAIGTSCAVCMKEFWTQDRLKLHLRKTPACLNVTAEADIGAEAIVGGSSRQCQWLPATRLVGPQPWWACLRPPAATGPPPSPTEAWRPYFRKFQQGVRSDRSQLSQAVREIVEHRVFACICQEDLPLSAAALSVSHRDLLNLLVAVSHSSPAPSAVTIFEGAWSASIFGERVIVRPVAFTGWAKLSHQLPTEWTVPE